MKEAGAVGVVALACAPTRLPAPPPPKKNTFFSVRTAKASVRRDRRHRRVATCGMRLVRPVRPVCPGRH